jgi:hypothetical protein
MMIQKMPSSQMNKSEKKTGYTHITYDLYGLKTYKEGRDRMIELNIKA